MVAEPRNLGHITQDTTNGLDWADWSDTPTAAGYLNGDGGWLAAGWTIATFADACAFVSNHGIGMPECPGSYGPGVLNFFEGLVASLDREASQSSCFDGSQRVAISATLQESGGQFTVYNGLTSGSSCSNGFVRVAAVGAGFLPTALVRSNTCDPLIPGSCQGFPVPPPTPCPPGLATCIVNGCTGSGAFWIGFNRGLRPRVTLQGDAGARFMNINEFPLGATQPFQVEVNGIVIGMFAPGDSVDFTLIDPLGVESFAITGLLDEITNPGEFALNLSLNAPDAEFTVIAGVIPVPSINPLGVALLLCLLGVTACGRLRGSNRDDLAAIPIAVA